MPAAAGGAAALGLVEARGERRAVPEEAGWMKFTMLHRSSARFSSGVPVSAAR
jgi:hypothetical protein